MEAETINSGIRFLQALIVCLSILVTLQVLTGISIACIVISQLRRVSRLLDIVERHGKISDEKKEEVGKAAKVMVDTAAKTALAVEKTAEAITQVREDVQRIASSNGSGESVVELHGPRARTDVRYQT